MSALLAALALASLPAANPLALPEGLTPSAVLPAPPAVSAAPLPASPASGGGASSSAFAAPIPSALALSSGTPSPLGLAGGALIILSLGAATLWIQKRKRQGPRHIQVVETASLGPKRSLALVVVGRQSMLLSCCDSGIFLVSSQPASPEMLQEADTKAAGFSSGLASGFSPNDAPAPLFRPIETPRAAAGFAAQLADAEETQGLRRRLSEAGVLR